MISYRTYILRQLLSLGERFDPPEEGLPKDPGKPSVAPSDVPVFEIEVMEKLEYYRDKALLVPTFEAFMDLLENVSNELGLNPAQDYDKLASVLNQYRVEKGLEPL